MLPDIGKALQVILRWLLTILLLFVLYKSLRYMVHHSWVLPSGQLLGIYVKDFFVEINNFFSQLL